jgi:hypothetical protein
VELEIKSDPPAATEKKAPQTQENERDTKGQFSEQQIPPALSTSGFWVGKDRSYEWYFLDGHRVKCGRRTLLSARKPTFDFFL